MQVLSLALSGDSLIVAVALLAVSTPRHMVPLVPCSASATRNIAQVRLARANIRWIGGPLAAAGLLLAL